MKSYVIIGLGRFGQRVSQQLCALGNEVLAIDTDAELVQQVSGCVTNAAVADAQDKDVLMALGVKECDCAVVAIGDSLAASVMATMNLQELGVPKIVCKAKDDAHRRVLEKLGADRVVIPEKEVADRLAHSLASANVLEYIELSTDYGIVEVPAPLKWIGRDLRDLNVRAKLGVNIIAVRTGHGVKISPPADYVVSQNDVMVLLGGYDALNVVQNL